MLFHPAALVQRAPATFNVIPRAGNLFPIHNCHLNALVDGGVGGDGTGVAQAVK